MRLALVVLIAGCRFGFGDNAPIGDASDAYVADASSPDAAPDSSLAGPIARYPMDDDASTGTIRAIPAAFSTTCTVCPTTTVGHAGGPAYQFGNGAMFQLPAAVTVGTAPYSVALWADPTGNTYGEVMVSKAYSNDSDRDVFNLIFNGSSALLSFETTDGATYEYLENESDLRGAWHHVVVTWDGTTKRFYLDGALSAQGDVQLVDSQLPMSVGVDFDNGGPIGMYSGIEEDLQIYDRALSAAEVAALP